MFHAKMSGLPLAKRVEVPDDAQDWAPEGYEPGPDDPGDISTECGPVPQQVHEEVDD